MLDVQAVTTRRARKQHRCDGWRCDRVIQPGEQYRRHVAFPGNLSVGNDRIEVLKQCSVCIQDSEGVPAFAIEGD